MKFLTNEEAQMRDEYEEKISVLHETIGRVVSENTLLKYKLDMAQKEIAKLREQIDTLVCAVESEGIKYHVDKDGNQHFDYSRVKEYRAEQIAEEVDKRLSENWKDIPANPSGFGMKLTDEEIEEVLGSEER